MAQNTLFRRTLCSLQIRLAAPHSRKASLATPRKLAGCSRFLPHAKNQRFFPRGPRLCLRLCPTKYPRFAAVLCGDPVVFPQKENARCSLAPRFSLCSKTIRRALIFLLRGGRLPPHFYRKASLATPRRNLWGVCFLPHAKNQRFFPRRPRLCLRLCPTKCPRFAAVLCGDPALFPQKKNARRSPRSSFCHFVPKLSHCSLIFAPRGGRLTPPVLFLRTSGFCVVAP